MNDGRYGSFGGLFPIVFFSMGRAFDYCNGGRWFESCHWMGFLYFIGDTSSESCFPTLRFPSPALHECTRSNPPSPHYAGFATAAGKPMAEEALL